MIRLLYFAWVREAIGKDGEAVDPPADVADVAALVAWLAARGGGYAEALADPARLRAAVDQTFAPLSTPIAGVGEIALFPPVTGG
ncbi:molybdopterin converting factor subunit 1 [Sphingomonas oryzagri]|uniref:Molybdopterin converting factor subunit 1 n=1 Tax=Sphingomonas oryzagri TaxID=3042314 RepID=A0ABT6N7E4_9SPHN|nr:molybdopterin converting factor subunit 1 [Sphingomonas oryzagri]MDH7641013.1 molybdopterin converting factor subunit 1 [Sphingomonas oryzagri]